MDQHPYKDDISDTIKSIINISIPLLVSVMSKLASEFRKGRRISFLSFCVIFAFAFCGGIIGQLLSEYLQFEKPKSTLLICSCCLMADKFFEYIFSKTFADAIFTSLQDWLVAGMKRFIRNSKKKED